MFQPSFAAIFNSITVQPSEPAARIAINLATFLTVLCWIFLLGFVVTRFSHNFRTRYAEFFGNRVFFLAWLVPTTAMFFSLYFSEYLGWTPCRFCWIQRGFIYPLAVLMLIYYFVHSKWLRRIGYILAGLCPFVSAFHIAVERNPDLEHLKFSFHHFFYIDRANTGFCAVANPCATVWFHSLHFLTTPGMALTAAVTIFVLLYMSRNMDSHNDEHQEAS